MEFTSGLSTLMEDHANFDKLVFEPLGARDWNILIDGDIFPVQGKVTVKTRCRSLSLLGPKVPVRDPKLLAKLCGPGSAAVAEKYFELWGERCAVNDGGWSKILTGLGFVLATAIGLLIYHVAK